MPNALTDQRNFLAAAVFATLNFYPYPDVHVAMANLAIVLFLVAVTTDALDGYLARKWQVESAFGRLMDPFCDKVLILGAFIYMTGPRFAFEREDRLEGVVYMATAVYPWMVMLILARELLVTGIRDIIVSGGVSFGSLWSGKAKMILQSIAIPIVLILTVNFHPAENAWAMRICQVLVYVTVLVTVWSGVPYIVGLRRMLLEQKRDGTES
jgi:phosphatidylglycerophosphate synthase